MSGGGVPRLSEWWQCASRAEGKQKLIQNGQRAWFAACPGSYHRLNNYSQHPNQRGHLYDSLPRPTTRPLSLLQEAAAWLGAGRVSKSFYVVIYY